jgi:cellobiose phosphorylase
MEELAGGLTENAIEVNEAGERKIIHGIGDKRSYKLGSWCDPDGKARRSGTANSFWAISGMVERDPSTKEIIVNTLKALDSKYGLLTFDVAFPYGMKEAGRVANITEGTYENCCAYVHASMFSIMALFILGESAEAWRQMEKSMVISHDNCTMTTFAMPNSYCCNPDYEIDGGSMGDWYTGSGAVLVKELIKFGFGIAPDLEGLKVQTPATMPCDNASIKVIVKGHPITLVYKNEGAGKRTFKVNGQVKEGVFNAIMEVENLFIPAADLADDMVIEVID